MKILERGTVPGTTPLQIRCVNCKTLFEFLPVEASVNYDQRDGDFYAIACPVCFRKCYKNIH